VGLSDDARESQFGQSLVLASLTVYAVSNRCQDQPINLLTEASNHPVTS
jgi:hypothetical protein